MLLKFFKFSVFHSEWHYALIFFNNKNLWVGRGNFKPVIIIVYQKALFEYFTLAFWVHSTRTQIQKVI